MSERTFTYTWTDAKRLTVLHALGFMYAKLQTSPAAVTCAVLGLIGELSRGAGKETQAVPTANSGGPQAPREVLSDAHIRRDHARDDDPKSQPSGTEAARAVLAPPPKHFNDLAPHDYFAADRKGNIPLKPPTGATLQVVEVVTTGESTDRKHLKVVFRVEGKTSKANCFDRELWPMLVKHHGPSAPALWIVEKGDYLNIVGVRA